MPDKARLIMSRGEAKLRVRRAGMLQLLTFKLRRVELGQDKFVELYSDRMIDMSEIVRLADETGLPVEAQNGRGFPEGKSAKDFMGL